MKRGHVVVVGAGMGGLAAAVDLARAGMSVTVCERAAEPGGKMRRVMVDGAGVDAGPTVFTMRWVFESLFADAGEHLDAHLDVRPAGLLARHAWREGGRLDLFADMDRSADAIGAFAGAAEARGYREFCARSADIYRTLAGPFIAAQRPSMFDLVRRMGVRNLPADAVGRAGAAFQRSQAAAALWPLCDLCRCLAVSGTGDIDADRPCRAGRRLAGAGRHPSRGTGNSCAGGTSGRTISIFY
jgi:phytoene dehydrogenase-like protein